MDAVHVPPRCHRVRRFYRRLRFIFTRRYHAAQVLNVRLPMLNFAPWFVFCQGILCPFLPLFTKILQIYYIKFAFSFFFRNFVAYLRVLCLHVGASEYKERENND